MTNEIKLTVRPFEMGTEKEAAGKVLEEASEAREMAQQVRECNYHHDKWCGLCDWKYRKNVPLTCKYWTLADEIADVIQASCNLAARYGINLQAAMERCEQRNRERGRYPMEEKHAEPSGSCGSNDCNCGGDCGNVSLGIGDLREKSPEEMSVEELIEALKVSYSASSTCVGTLGADWCESFDYCNTCRKQVLDLLGPAHEREVEKVRVDTTCAIARGEIAEMKQQIADLTNERDGLRRRLEELSNAGITELHRLLRETLGEAKNVTHNARVYINKQQGNKDERYGDCGNDSGCDSCDCGAERAKEHVLSNEPPAREMSEREKVLERLRRYTVYMTEPPSENANRLLACITGESVMIACKDDIESVRDKLIELLSDGE